MSTTNVENWAEDGPLADFGAIYPFVGSEGLLVIVLLIAWVGWHVWQIGLEKRQEEEQMELLEREEQRGGDAP